MIYKGSGKSLISTAIGLKPEHITFLELTPSINKKKKKDWKTKERGHVTVPIPIILHYILTHSNIKAPMENKMTKISCMLLLTDLERN